MSHKLLEDEVIEKKKKKVKLTLPKIEGRFGFAFYIGMKEVFIGILLTDVVKEEITRKRFIKAPKGKIQVYRFDSAD